MIGYLQAELQAHPGERNECLPSGLVSLLHCSHAHHYCDYHFIAYLLHDREIQLFV